MNVYIESLGCARNQVDSENMASRLRAAGWEVIRDPAEADAIVVNTCSFIEAAADESIDTILALSEHKRSGRCRRLVVAGCLPQRYGPETSAAMPEVDLFLGTGAYERIGEVLGGQAAAGTCFLPDPDRIDTGAVVLRRPFRSPSAYLKIAEGCSRHCTYCIIPRLRGRQKSRPMETILAEARDLIGQGVRELTLVAQETTAYGRDLNAPLELSMLLRELARLDSSVWIRFLYGHPESISMPVLETVAQFPNLCPYFDIPIQHASTPLLRLMGRRSSFEGLMSLFARIRSTVPGAVVRTTVLVGFPGETDADFEVLKQFVREVGFDHLGAFIYSDAPDLPAHNLKRHVPAEKAKRRLDELMRLQQAVSARKMAQWKGRSLTVLVEERTGEDLWIGRTAFQAPEVDGTTLIRGRTPIAPGDFVPVRIVDTLEYDLIGEPLECKN